MAHLLTPLIMVILVFCLQMIANDVSNTSDVNPPVMAIPNLTNCGSNNCTTVGIAILGNSSGWIDQVISGLESDFNLKFGTDIKLIYQGLNYSQILDDILEGSKMKIGVIFCNTDDAFITIYNQDYSLPCITGQPYISAVNLIVYTILMDKTGNSMTLYSSPSVSLPKDPNPLSLKMSIDNSLISLYRRSKGLSNLTIQFTQEDFPKVPSRMLENYNVLASEGAFYFMIPSLFSFLIIINEILKEKEYKQRIYLNVLGVGNFVYYFNWFIFCFIFSILTSLVLIISGYCFQFNFFLNTNFLILLFFFGTFSFTMQNLGIFICTVVKDQNSGKSVAYAFILISGVIELFTANIYIVYQFYLDILPNWFLVVRFFLNLYPPFNYTKIFGSIANKSGKHFDVNTLSWKEGPGFSWSDLTESQSQKSPIGDMYFQIPSVLETYGNLIINCFVFMIMIWYFDHVISSNRGIKDSYIFFIPKKIRGYISKICKKRVKGSLLMSIQNPNLMDDSPNQEQENVEKSQIEGKVVKGIRILNVSKTYSTGFFRPKNLKALKNITFEVKENELISLLGHNGAGKTTLINILIGITEPNEGKIMISGLNAKKNQNDLRQVIGICPQFDILWNELTITDHIELVAQIKGINDKVELNELTQNLLQKLDLYSKKDIRVKLYSGGMRRRTTLGLSTIGNPKVIFMDEPTTGMDPLSRRKIWNLISEIKTGKAVILTTHSMEEADILSNKIIVMVSGEIKSIGSSLFLKKTYGEGYRITLFFKNTLALKIQDELKKVAKDLSIVVRSPGTIQIIISFDNSSILKKFFKEIEKGKLREYIDDWGLSHSTIEEAFLKITKKK